MVNSRGGFLVEDPEALGEKAAIEKKRREERAKAQGRGAFEPGEFRSPSQPSRSLVAAITI